MIMALINVSIRAQVAVQTPLTTAESANQVVQWNRNLLSIVRTPGAQPGTIHSTRSFAIMHAAIYDAVNAIDGTHHKYLVQIGGVSPDTSQEAAAASPVPTSDKSAANRMEFSTLGYPTRCAPERALGRPR